jgi:hypothetical protein
MILWMGNLKSDNLIMNLGREKIMKDNMLMATYSCWSTGTINNCQGGSLFIKGGPGLHGCQGGSQYTGYVMTLT